MYTYYKSYQYIRVYALVRSCRKRSRFASQSLASNLVAQPGAMPAPGWEKPTKMDIVREKMMNIYQLFGYIMACIQ